MIKKLNITIKNMFEIINFCSFIFIIVFYYLLQFNMINFFYYKANYSSTLLLIICLIHFVFYLFLNKDNIVNKINNEIFYLICAFIVLIYLLIAIALVNDIIDIKYIKDGTLLRYSGKVLFSIITLAIVYIYRKNSEVNIFVISKSLAITLLLLFFITQSQTILYLLQGSVFLAIFPNLFLQNLHKIKYLWNNMLCFIKNIMYTNNINNKHILAGALFSRLIYNVILVGIVEPLPLDNGGISNNSVAGRGSTPPDLSGGAGAPSSSSGAGAPPRQIMPVGREVPAKELIVKGEIVTAGAQLITTGAVPVPAPSVKGLAAERAAQHLTDAYQMATVTIPRERVRAATQPIHHSRAPIHGPVPPQPIDYGSRSTAKTAAPKRHVTDNGVSGSSPELPSSEKIVFDGYITSAL